MKLYIIRHAESEANVQDRLAGQLDVPLSPRGVGDSMDIARAFCRTGTVDRVYCSPLTRAFQTARPFVQILKVPLHLDDRLMEQDIGVFTGRTYAEAEGDPGYEKRREMRWDWKPEGGESYRAIAERVRSFFASLDPACPSCLIVTHAVTMRLMRAVLESTLPSYPLEIAKNGEIWELDFKGSGQSHELRSLWVLDRQAESHRA